MTETATLIDASDGRPHQGAHLSGTREIRAIRGTLYREIWMSIAHDETHETAPLPLVPPTLTPHSPVQLHRIVVEVLAEDAADFLGAVETFTTMTGKDTTTHVIAFRNGHIGRGVGHPQGARSETFGKIAISTGENVTIEGSPESTTPTSAQQVLRNQDYGRWTHTEVRALLI